MVYLDVPDLADMADFSGNSLTFWFGIWYCSPFLHLLFPVFLLLVDTLADGILNISISVRKQQYSNDKIRR